MPHAHGTYLGAVQCLETLRQRCVVDDGGAGCWHLRTARGRPLPRGRGARHGVFVHGLGLLTGTRAAWLFATGALPPDGHVVWRHCSSHDCVKPGHLRCTTRADYGRAMGQLGRWRGQWARIAANRATAVKRRKLTDEQVAHIINSTATHVALAQQLGCHPRLVAAVRTGKRRVRSAPLCASVFDFEA